MKTASLVFYCLLAASIFVLFGVSSTLSSPLPELNQEYINLEQKRSEPQVLIPAGPVLREGDNHDHVMLLTARLNELGYYVPLQFTFDENITAALKKAQAELLINDDGVLGPQTRAALNVTPEVAQALVEQATEEWHTRVGLNLPARYIVVNIPSYELIAYEYGVEVFRSKVIVGSVRNKTPLMVTEAYSLKFNPDWTAPPGINREYRGKLAAGKLDYFQKNGVRVIHNSDGTIKFWQPPSRSYLGDLKVELKNPYNVYLHDTNNRSKFSKAVRALSHGCIRVESYKELAAWLSSSSVDDIERRIATGKTHWQSIDSVTVYTVYMLAYPNADGRIGYFEDIYRRY